MEKLKKFYLPIFFSFLFLDSGAQNCGQLISKADSFYAIKQYDQVIELLERLVFFKCDGDYLSILGNSYYETGNYGWALSTFLDEKKKTKSIEKRREAILGCVKSNIQLGNYENGLQLLQTEYNKNGLDTGYIKRLKFYTFLSYWKAGEVDSAEKWGLSYLDKSPAKQAKAKAYFSEFKEKQKIPNLALAMNVVLPGSGFVYTENKKKAIAAFAVNSVLAASTIYTASQYYPAYAIVAVGSWWVRYYAGGIVNGYNSAIYFNRDLKDKWKEKVLELMK